MCRRDIYYDNIKSTINWDEYDKDDKDLVEKVILKTLHRCYIMGHALSTDFISYNRQMNNESDEDYNERLKIYLFCSKYAYDFRDKKCFQEYQHMITDHGRLLTDDFKKL